MDTEKTIREIEHMIELEWRCRFPADLVKDYIEALEVAVDALRKDEIDRLEKPCEWCEGNVSKYFDTNWYDFTAENTGVRPKAKFCPNCGRKLDWEY